MTLRTRRELFSDVGRGMIAAAVGTGLAADLGFAFAPIDDAGHIRFGDLEPLVALLQETPAGQTASQGRLETEGWYRPEDIHRGRGSGECPRFRRRGLRRLPHAHGTCSRLQDGERRDQPRAAAPSRHEGAGSQQYAAPGNGRPEGGSAQAGQGRPPGFRHTARRTASRDRPQGRHGRGRCGLRRDLRSWQAGRRAQCTPGRSG